MAMKREGTELVNHYIGLSACTPSRAVIWTGQQIALHGVAYTPGAAKVEHENDNFHLDFNTVPTLGNILIQLLLLLLVRIIYNTGTSVTRIFGPNQS